MADVEAVTVWRADERLRIGAYVVIAVLLLLSVRVLYAYGYLALIGVGLVLLAIGNAWWNLLRPQLSAGPDGVVVVAGRDTIRLPWKDIRSCEPGPNGLIIHCANGRDVVSRFPQQTKAAASEATVADQTAMYLAQRAAWARKPTGDRPRYQPPAPAKK